jgi:dihydroxyacid dehydratase/phosphogluconate dehydratase
MKRAKYIGPEAIHKGQTALVKELDEILVQFDNRESEFAYGWHKFPRKHWEIENKDAIQGWNYCLEDLCKRGIISDSEQEVLRK